MTDQNEMQLKCRKTTDLEIVHLNLIVFSTPWKRRSMMLMVDFEKLMDQNMMQLTGRKKKQILIPQQKD